MPDTLSYGQAVNAALDQALGELPEMLLFGEDVGRPGGVFQITKGLQERHGERVFDTPISESAILGGAVGAAMMGRRPVVEIMWSDFSLVALDQIVNQAANVRYVSRGRLTAPLTIRTQQGVLAGSCAQHSQSLEAFFAHTPGLVVGMPATPQDAYTMLLDAIWSDDPAIVIENRGLYFTLKAEVDRTHRPRRPGGARVAREGGDVTIVTWGSMLHTAVQAAGELDARHGVSAEVIDLRWLVPLDEEAVLDSVRRTNRLLVVHEANRTAGFGAEIAARVSDAAFDDLDAPVRRLGTPDVRMPAAPHLQQALVPDAAAIVEAARALL